jgi:glycine cleavage system H protein
MTGEKEKTSRASRSEFLRNACLAVGSVTVASLTVNSACKLKTASTNITSQINLTQSTIPSALSTAKHTTATNTGDTSITNSIYTLLSEEAPTLILPNLNYTIAADRLYSTEHIWVKSISSDMVFLGVTDKLQLLMGTVAEVAISPEGSTLTSGESMGNLYAEKINFDIIAPVSGTIVRLNDDIKSNPAIINYIPYGRGWMLIVRLSKPDELQELLTPEGYADLVS